MSKKRRMPVRKKIIINGREWKLESRNNESGAEFCTYDKRGTGIIKVGTKGATKRSIIESIVHEVIEGTLTDEHRRWNDGAGRMIFCFDHEYLYHFCPKVVTALVSCGVLDPDRKVL